MSGPNVFISYRRSDVDGYAVLLVGRIYDRLVAEFGKSNVFMDLDTIGLGVDFRHRLDEALSRCNVVLAVIGKQWLGLMKERAGTADFVELELLSAVQRGVPVVPLLIGVTRIPKETDLPQSISRIVFHQGFSIDALGDFHGQMERLVRALARFAPAPVSSIDAMGSAFRPKGNSPHIFLHHSTFSLAVKRYPFDLFIGLEEKDFELRYSGLVAECGVPVRDSRLFCLRPRLIEDERGRINDQSTFFLFSNGVLKLASMSLTMDPVVEKDILGSFDQKYFVHFGDRYSQGSIQFWLSEDSLWSELLSCRHGLSSGVNEFWLFESVFVIHLLNDLGDVSIEAREKEYEEFHDLLRCLGSLVSSSQYRTQVFARFEAACSSVVLEAGIEKCRLYLESLE